MKNTQSNDVNGKLSVNALPIFDSLLTPVKDVANTITDKPIRPTAAKWKAKPAINQHAMSAWLISETLSSRVKALICFSAVGVFRRLIFND